MINVVFTGPAFNNAGQSVVRSALAEACLAKGNLKVQPRVAPDTDMLVASRTDTVKAKTAAVRGVAVLTYPEFINRFLQGVEIETGAKPNKYTDVVNKDLLVPDFSAPATALAALDIL